MNNLIPWDQIKTKYEDLKMPRFIPEPKERTFHFSVTLIGDGENWEKAWLDAVQALSEDPLTPCGYREIDPETDEYIDDDWKSPRLNQNQKYK